ncbi:unnamed protein product [Choristocarpus tenellus]
MTCGHTYGAAPGIGGGVTGLSIMEKNGSSPSAGPELTDACMPEDAAAEREDGRTLTWLSLGKQAAEAKCRELEMDLAKMRESLAKHATRLRTENVFLTPPPKDTSLYCELLVKQ